jgi:hypothetical protein
LIRTAGRNILIYLFVPWVTAIAGYLIGNYRSRTIAGVLLAAGFGWLGAIVMAFALQPSDASGSNAPNRWRIEQQARHT